MIMRFYIDGLEVSEPLNYQEIQIQLNKSGDNFSNEVSVASLEWGVSNGTKPNDPYILIKRAFSKGVNGGVGVSEGLPLRIEIDNQKGTTYTLYDGLIDLWGTEYKQSKAVTPLIQRKSLDWLNDIAPSITFDYLRDIGIVTDSDYVKIKYVVEKERQTTEVVLLLISLFVVSYQLYKEIQDLLETIEQVGGVFTTFPAIAALVGHITFILVLFVSIVTLVTQLIKMFLQKIKCHYGMTFLSHFEAICRHFGLVFRSSILHSAPFNSLIYLPEKYYVPSKVNGFVRVFGFSADNMNETTGHHKGTVADFVQLAKTIFNAKLLIQDGVMYFENVDFQLGNGAIQLPNMEDMELTFTLNKDAYKSTIIYSFATDFNDINTVNEFEGTSVQITQTPKAITDKSRLLGGGLLEIRPNVALAKKKRSLTDIEKVIDKLITGAEALVNLIIDAVNKVIEAVNAIIELVNTMIKAMSTLGLKLSFRVPSIPTITPVSFTKPSESRIGLMKMADDTISVPKILFLDQNGKLSSDNDNLTAYFMFSRFYTNVLFDPAQNLNGQRKIRSIEKMSFSFAQYEQSMKGNSIITPWGTKGAYTSLSFNPFEQTASIEFYENFVYSQNFTTTKTIPNGK